MICQGWLQYTRSLSKNSLGDDGATVLATALGENESLFRLLLAKNLIGDKGGRRLFLALRTNKTVHVLRCVSRKH